MFISKYKIAFCSYIWNKQQVYFGHLLQYNVNLLFFVLWPTPTEILAPPLTALVNLCTNHNICLIAHLYWHYCTNALTMLVHSYHCICHTLRVPSYYCIIVNCNLLMQWYWWAMQQHCLIGAMMLFHFLDL